MRSAGRGKGGTELACAIIVLDPPILFLVSHTREELTPTHVLPSFFNYAYCRPAHHERTYILLHSLQGWARASQPIVKFNVCVKEGMVSLVPTGDVGRCYERQIFLHPKDVNACNLSCSSIHGSMLAGHVHACIDHHNGLVLGTLLVPGTCSLRCRPC